jgi:hypothetical protein
MSTETYIPGQKLTPEQIEAWVLKYESTGKLPSHKIPCSSGNRVETTMFGDNLHKRVAKFGNIRELLMNFKSRPARAAEKAQALLTKIAKNAPAIEQDATDLTGGSYTEE